MVIQLKEKQTRYSNKRATVLWLLKVLINELPSEVNFYLQNFCLSLNSELDVKTSIQILWFSEIFFLIEDLPRELKGSRNDKLRKTLEHFSFFLLPIQNLISDFTLIFFADVLHGVKNSGFDFKYRCAIWDFSEGAILITMSSIHNLPHNLDPYPEQG